MIRRSRNISRKLTGNVSLRIKLAIQVVVTIRIGTLVGTPSTPDLRAALPDQLGVMIRRCWVVDVVLRHLGVPPVDTGLSPRREVWHCRFGDQVKVVDVLSIDVVGLE